MATNFFDKLATSSEEVEISNQSSSFPQDDDVFVLNSKFEGTVYLKIIFPYFISEVMNKVKVDENKSGLTFYTPVDGHYLKDNKFINCLRDLKSKGQCPENHTDDDCPICNAASLLWAEFEKGSNGKIPPIDSSKDKIRRMFNKPKGGHKMYVGIGYVIKTVSKDGKETPINDVKLLSLPKSVVDKIFTMYSTTIEQLKKKTDKTPEEKQKYLNDKYFNKNGLDFLMIKEAGAKGQPPVYNNSSFNDADFSSPLTDEEWGKAIKRIIHLYYRWEKGMLFKNVTSYEDMVKKSDEYTMYAFGISVYDKRKQQEQEDEEYFNKKTSTTQTLNTTTKTTKVETKPAPTSVSDADKKAIDEMNEIMNDGDEGEDGEMPF